MIFVSLGTQDKPFVRLLDYLEHSNIKDKIIVQAGFTDYESKKFEIHKYLDKDDFDKYINEADLVICHGGVGTIISCLNKNKKVLAVPRLSKYKEHQNDHQLQIVNAYYQKGYLVMMNDGDDFDDKVREALNFKPKKFVSNNDLFVKKLKEYIML